MARVTTREGFKQHLLRNLGAPLLEINVAEEQLDDIVDEALSYYYDYHFDGSQKVYLAHQITQEDVDNRYLTIPENVIGVINIFDVGTSYSTNNMFNLRYQLSLNDLYSFRLGEYAPYYMMIQNIELAEQLFVGKQSLRFNRHVNRLYIDMSWRERISVGEYIIVEGYSIVDPETYPDVWEDRWLKRYATAMVKQQWGTNLKKFDGIAMPGGVTFNGQKIYDEASEELDKLEQEMISSYSLPVSDMIG